MIFTLCFNIRLAIIKNIIKFTSNLFWACFYSMITEVPSVTQLYWPFKNSQDESRLPYSFNVNPFPHCFLILPLTNQWIGKTFVVHRLGNNVQQNIVRISHIIRSSLLRDTVRVYPFGNEHLYSPE